MNIFKREPQVGNVVSTEEALKPKTINLPESEEERLALIRKAFGEPGKLQAEKLPELPEEEPEEELKDNEIAEIIACDIDKELGFIYKVRSNNPNFHLGLCQLEQD